MTTVVDAPSRVGGVELIGEMAGSGYRTPPALVRRHDGQVLQLTPLLYLVLKAVDGQRSYADIADVVGRALRRQVTPAQAEELVDGHLRKLGLVSRADGQDPELKRSNPLLALKLKVAVTDPHRTRRITDPFRLLFRPFVVVPVLLGFLAVVTWVFFERGLGASAYDAFERPHLLLLVFVLSVLSGGFHEFGHAAAARYGGAQPGVMGAGIYLVWPAFYTDVTDSYRLGRGGRIRTDLGGLYFNAVVVVLVFAAWWSTGWEALLLVVATQVLQMVHQLLPLLRFDGYHLLADIAGVPDLYHRIKPTLVGLLPHRWKDQENRVLKPWARALITLWVLVTVPMMVMMLLVVVTTVPRLLGSAFASMGENAAAVRDAATTGNVLDVAAHSVQVLAVLLPVLATALILGRVGGRFFKGLALWSRGSVVRRVVATATAAAVVTCLLWTWWPQPGTYRPIEAGERGLLTSFVPGARAEAADDPATPLGRAAAFPTDSRLPADRPLTATFAKDQPLPTKDEPQLAMVLVPTDPDAGTGGATSSPAPGGSEDVWVFPFDRPLPPEEGDNQALAVNTKDGSTVYDIAFALVWAEGDEVLNVNEAHAYASCSDCVSVAVAFQVVLVMDDAHVIVPQNLAVAANYDCYRCITAAIASQLVLTVSEDPDESQLQSLAALWQELTAFARQITRYTLTEIAAKLEEVKTEIAGILGVPTTTSGEATATASPTTGVSSASPSPSGGASPSGTGSSPATGATSGPASSAPEPAPTSAPVPSEPTPTQAPEPATSAPASSEAGTAGTAGTASP